MKKRNPLFVAGFPYGLFMIGYVGLQVIGGVIDTTAEGTDPSASVLIGFMAALILFVIGGAYGLYWLIDTAKELKRQTGMKIPTAFLLVIPLANYWWMWRYSQVAEVYTKGRVQGAMGFVLLVLLGAIGMGILQDTYNKQLSQ